MEGVDAAHDVPIVESAQHLATQAQSCIQELPLAEAGASRAIADGSTYTGEERGRKELLMAEGGLRRKCAADADGMQPAAHDGTEGAQIDIQPGSPTQPRNRWASECEVSKEVAHLQAMLPERSSGQEGHQKETMLAASAPGASIVVSLESEDENSLTQPQHRLPMAQPEPGAVLPWDQDEPQEESRSLGPECEGEKSLRQIKEGLQVHQHEPKSVPCSLDGLPPPTRIMDPDLSGVARMPRLLSRGLRREESCLPDVPATDAWPVALLPAESPSSKMALSCASGVLKGEMVQPPSVASSPRLLAKPLRMGWLWREEPSADAPLSAWGSSSASRSKASTPSHTEPITCPGKTVFYVTSPAGADREECTTDSFSKDSSATGKEFLGPGISACSCSEHKGSKERLRSKQCSRASDLGSLEARSDACSSDEPSADVSSTSNASGLKCERTVEVSAEQGSQQSGALQTLLRQGILGSSLLFFTAVGGGLSFNL